MKSTVKTQSLQNVEPAFRFMVEVYHDSCFKILDTAKVTHHEKSNTTEFEWVATAFTRGIALHLAKILNESPYEG